MKLADEVISLLKQQGFVIVSTLDENNSLHSSCKGVVRIEKSGLVYLMDVYRARTYENLKRNPTISLTAVNEHGFKGYCLKGKAEIVPVKKLDQNVLESWDAKVTSRITQRLIRNISGEKGHSDHPESLLPRPEYMIVMKVEEIVDLTPQHIKQGA